MAPETPAARIPPLAPPYPAELAALLDRMTPPGAPGIPALFRVLARHPVLAERMTPWGGFLLGRRARLPLRDREIVIDRVCALCGAAYEWGIHVAAFGEAAGLTTKEIAAIADPASDLSALPPRDRVLVRVVDALHERADVDDALWAELAAGRDEAQRLELLMLAGWYHAIAYVCNVSRVAPEPWGAPWPAG